MLGVTLSVRSSASDRDVAGSSASDRDVAGLGVSVLNPFKGAEERGRS
jgi:hypothetical protein